ncbi:GNAT family N-acetyltransferase [Halobacterium zhouii]|uniref:GNAT family N-acetyltransferase n=1 Tax=Halobacterium zhouii TaxID=2902624 RepID=UPI001E2B145F|nr:GNAT family protein [Halobacterium zhouii]
MPGPAFLAGDGVTLRTVEEEDVEFFQTTINDPAVRTTLGMRTPINGEQEQEWFEEHASGDEHADFVICDGEESVGNVGIGPVEHPDGKAEIGIYVAEEHWGNGYGTEAGRLITDYAFRELRKHRVVARVFDGNEGSRRVWEKLGFRHEAVHEEAQFMDGEYVDVHFYAVLEDEWFAEN